MKIFILAVLLILSGSTFAADSVIKDTTINKVTYHLYRGAKGGRYIIVTSKQGNQYRKYIKN